MSTRPSRHDRAMATAEGKTILSASELRLTCVYSTRPPLIIGVPVDDDVLIHTSVVLERAGCRIAR